MALVSCEECGRKISDMADACPHCGMPLEPPATNRRRVQTVEQTGKGIKAMQLLCVVVIVFGMGGWIANAGQKPDVVAPFVLMFFGGFAAFIFFRFIAWWYHG